MPRSRRRTSTSDAEGNQRDRQIARFGDQVGQSFVILGAVSALLLALLEADSFQIAQVFGVGLDAVFQYPDTDEGAST